MQAHIHICKLETYPKHVSAEFQSPDTCHTHWERFETLKTETDYKQNEGRNLTPFDQSDYSTKSTQTQFVGFSHQSKILPGQKLKRASDFGDTKWGVCMLNVSYQKCGL